MTPFLISPSTSPASYGSAYEMRQFQSSQCNMEEPPMFLSPPRSTSSSQPTLRRSVSPTLEEERWERLEDASTVCLKIPLEGMQGKDVSLRLQGQALVLEGTRRYYGNDVGGKRQRIQREFVLGDLLPCVDLSRAQATLWKDSLLLQAPKQVAVVEDFDEEELEELVTPCAEQLLQQDCCRY